MDTGHHSLTILNHMDTGHHSLTILNHIDTGHHSLTILNHIDTKVLRVSRPTMDKKLHMAVDL